jgi:hypothetical protein
MTKAPIPTGSAFPWGLVAQVVLLVIEIIEEVVEQTRKK